MTGDIQDIVARLKATLPAGWFPDSTPVLDAILSGLGSAWSWIYGFLCYVTAQTRLATATDIWLDIAAQDFFGSRITRSGRVDADFRTRIQQEIMRERGTRAAIASVLEDLTGREPVIFEPANTSDTGGWGSVAALDTGLSFGAAGGWGSLSLPFQCFVTAYRPLSEGIAQVGGWSASAGGYGCGALEYADLALMAPMISDSEIFAAAASVVPTATIAWTRISN